MGLEAAFLSMASTTVTVEPLSTHNAWGAPVYSTGTSTYPARVEYGPRLSVGKGGVLGGHEAAHARQEIATAIAYVLSTSATIGVQDRVTLPRDTAARLIRVDVVNDEHGQHHLQLTFA